MLAFDLLKRVSHATKKVVVGGDNGAVQVEFNFRLTTRNGGDFSSVVDVLDFLKDNRASQPEGECQNNRSDCQADSQKQPNTETSRGFGLCLIVFMASVTSVTNSSIGCLC